MSMDEARRARLERGEGSLTQEEQEQGWHFCHDWDGMLIGPGWDEMEVCLCPVRGLSPSRGDGG